MLDSEVDQTIQIDSSGIADYRSAVSFFARQLLKDLRLVGGYDQIYPQVKTVMRDHLFTGSSNPVDPVILRNLSEPEVSENLGSELSRPELPASCRPFRFILIMRPPAAAKP